MNILFINPVTPPDIFPVRMTMGVAYISAVLKEKGHSTKLIMPYKFSEKQLAFAIENFNPELVLVSSVTDQIELSEKIINYVYDKYNLPILLGGTHATVAPEHSIEIRGVLGICIGEGEKAVLELVEKLEKKKDYSKINNLWIKKGNKTIKNPLGKLIQDLDKLPFPDREMFEGIDTTDELEFMGSRGCPFQCTYCINKALVNKYKGCGKYVRIRTVDNLISEIKQTLKKYKTAKVLFHDDTFTLDKKWLEEFCEKYTKEIGMPYAANGRVETMDEEVVKMLKDSGCVEIKIGVETGNEELRKKVLNRNMSNEQIINVFRLCKKHNLQATSFNMIGLPYETEKNVKETIALNKKIKPLRMGVSVFRPYPGTEMYEVCKKNNWISPRRIKSYFEDISILDMPQLPAKKIHYYHKTFKLSVYHPFLAVLAKVLIKAKLYSCIEWAFKTSRNTAVKLLTRKQKDFLQRVLKV